jgi:SPIN90/Ldb17, leucine-rich domain/SH3 domain
LNWRQNVSTKTKLSVKRSVFTIPSLTPFLFPLYLLLATLLATGSEQQWQDALAANDCHLLLSVFRVYKSAVTCAADVDSDKLNELINLLSNALHMMTSLEPDTICAVLAGHRMCELLCLATLAHLDLDSSTMPVGFTERLELLLQYLIHTQVDLTRLDESTILYALDQLISITGKSYIHMNTLVSIVRVMLVLSYIGYCHNNNCNLLYSASRVADQQRDISECIVSVLNKPLGLDCVIDAGNVMVASKVLMAAYTFIQSVFAMEAHEYFFTNDIFVIIDILCQRIADAGPDDAHLPHELQTLYMVLIWKEYTKHKYKPERILVVMRSAAEIATSFPASDRKACESLVTAISAVVRPLCPNAADEKSASTSTSTSASAPTSASTSTPARPARPPSLRTSTPSRIVPLASLRSANSSSRLNLLQDEPGKQQARSTAPRPALPPRRTPISTGTSSRAVPLVAPRPTIDLRDALSAIRKSSVGAAPPRPAAGPGAGSSVPANAQTSNDNIAVPSLPPRPVAENHKSAIVLHRYIGGIRQDKELHIEPDDHITVTRVGQDGWSFGFNPETGTEGWFPTTYIKILD